MASSKNRPGLPGFGLKVRLPGLKIGMRIRHLKVRILAEGRILAHVSREQLIKMPCPA